MTLNVELDQIYAVYRDCALNQEYYGRKLVRFQRVDTTMEIGIALFASGSALSSLLKATPIMEAWWPLLAAISAVLALAKPILRLNKKVAAYSRLFTGHLDNYLQMRRLVMLITRKQTLNDEMRRQFERALTKYLELSRDDDPAPSKRLVARCEEIVSNRIPPNSLWYPPCAAPSPPQTGQPAARSLAIVTTSTPQDAPNPGESSDKFASPS